MEKVCSRPRSLSAVRQRSLSDTDYEFRWMQSRFNKTAERLNLTTGMSRLDLKSLPADVSLPLPTARRIQLEESPTPRTITTSSARFTYEGYDLTGVIRNRMLNDQVTPCERRREGSIAIALKRHISRMAERKSSSGRRTIHSALSNTELLATMNMRREQRDKRQRPWTEQPPTYQKPCAPVTLNSLMDYRTFKKKSAEKQRKVSEKEAWDAERQQELEVISKMDDYQPLTVMVIASHQKRCDGAEVMKAVRDNSCTLSVLYDYENDNYKDILSYLRNALDSCCLGVKAERILFICPGNPGHFFLLHKQIITSTKVRKDNEIRGFWIEVGKLLSKVNPSKARLIIGGSDMASTSAGRELLSDIRFVIKPNIATVSSLPIIVEEAEQEAEISQFFTSLKDYEGLFFEEFKQLEI